MYHDGFNSYITDVGTGNLFVQASNVLWLRDASGTAYFSGTSGNEVALYHNGSEKLSTTSTGVDVTGTVNLTGSVDFGNWTITESGGSLYFATGGVNKMKLDASGNLDVVGNVNTNATIT